VKPEPMLTEGSVIDKINAQFEQTSSVYVAGLKRMEDFREEITSDLNELQGRADAIKDKFRKFVSA
jgi:hypothetical protein